MAAHRYWRLYVTDNNDPSGGPGSNRYYTSLIELEMFVTPGGANQCTGGTAIASSDYVGAGWSKNNAFDGVKNNDVGWAANNAPLPVWLGYDFGSGNDKDIVEFAITARQDTGSLAQHPKNFVLQFSDDGDFWYDTMPITGQTGWTYNQTRTFDADPFVPPNVVLQSHFNEIEAINVGVSGSVPQIRGTFAGDAEISGTISIESEPIQNAIVRLHHADTGQLLRSTVSDGIGDYEFLNVKRDALYDVVAEDPNKLWEKKVSSRRSPFVALKLKTRGRSGEAAGFTFYGDPYWNDVTSYLDFTGADGSTTFTDRKGLTWVANGAAQINSNSLLLNGNNDHITATPDSSKSFGTGNFTMESWITLNARASGDNCIFDSLNLGGNGSRPNSIIFGVRPSGSLFAFQNGSYIFQAGFVPLSTLIHVAISRVDGVIYGSVAGTIVASVTNGFNDTVGGFCIGLAADVPSSVPHHTDGRIHNLRITKAGRYKTNFTPEFKLPTG